MLYLLKTFLNMNFEFAICITQKCIAADVDFVGISHGVLDFEIISDFYLTMELHSTKIAEELTMNILNMAIQIYLLAELLAATTFF